MLLIIAMCRKITSHWQLLFSKKMAAAASFSYKIGSGKDLETLLAAVLTWSRYWTSGGAICRQTCQYAYFIHKCLFGVTNCSA